LACLKLILNVTIIAVCVSRLFASSGHPSSLQNGRQADQIQSAVTALPATGQAASSEVMSLSSCIGRVAGISPYCYLPGLTCRARRRRTSSCRVAVAERSRGCSSLTGRQYRRPRSRSWTSSTPTTRITAAKSRSWTWSSDYRSNEISCQNVRPWIQCVRILCSFCIEAVKNSFFCTCTLLSLAYVDSRCVEQLLSRMISVSLRKSIKFSLSCQKNITCAKSFFLKKNLCEVTTRKSCRAADCS
jgi:hypothetical protein